MNKKELDQIELTHWRKVKVGLERARVLHKRLKPRVEKALARWKAVRDDPKVSAETLKEIIDEYAYIMAEQDAIDREFDGAELCLFRQKAPGQGGPQKK